MADGDSDEGEDIFVNSVCLHLFSAISERPVMVYPVGVGEPVTAALSDQTGCQEISENILFTVKNLMSRLYVSPGLFCRTLVILSSDGFFVRVADVRFFIPNSCSAPLAVKASEESRDREIL